MSELLDSARAYKAIGYSPWPSAPGAKMPLRYPPGPNGRTWGGRNHTPLTDDEIAHAWGGKHPPDIALVVRDGQGIFDLDPKNNAALTALYDDLIRVTRCAYTPSGGLHAYLRQRDGGRVPLEHPAQGVDLQGYGGLVIAPPSRGRRWANVDTQVLEVENVAEWVRAFLHEHGIETRAPVEYLSDEDRIIADGARNVTLTSIAGLLRKVGLAPNLIREAVRGIATSPSTSENVRYEDGEIEEIAANIGVRGSEPFNTGMFEIESIASDDIPDTLAWLVPGVIPDEGITLLYGLPAQGKSWTALDIAVSVQGGYEWLTGKCAKRKTLYIDWERRGKMFRRRLRQIAHDRGVVLDYMVARGSLAQMVPEIAMLVRARGYQFVIIDSLSISMMGADMMAAHEVIPAMFGLHEIGVPILALDHQKKLYEKENPWAQGAYGSIFKEAVASCVWQAGKIDPRTFTHGYMNFKLHHRKNNFDMAPPDIWIRLELPADDTPELDKRVRLALTAPGGDDQEQAPSARVLDALGQRDPGAMTRAEIEAATGLTKSQAQYALAALETDGIVRVVDPGSGARGASYGLVPHEAVA